MKGEGQKLVPSSFCHLILVEPAGQLRQQARVLDKITPRYIRRNAVIAAGKISAFCDEWSHPHHFGAHGLATCSECALVNSAAERDPVSVLAPVLDNVIPCRDFDGPSVIKTPFDPQGNEFGDVTVRVY